MKKTQLIFGLGSMATMMGLAVTPLLSLAAPTHSTTVAPRPPKPATIKQDSSAGFEVLPGTLSLNQVPSLRFGKTNISEIIRGTTLKNPAIANSLQVTDYQGTHEGWQLMVGMSHFENGSQRQSANLELGLSKTKTDNAQTAGPMSKVALASTEMKNGTVSNYTTVWSAKKQTGQGVNHADVTAAETNLKLTNPQISKGTYSANLFWTLQVGPEAAAAE